MEPDVSIEGAAVIRVVVLPVGDISPATFREYSSMVLASHKIDLPHVSSFYTEHQKSPFQYQPWDTGCLQFKFILGGASRGVWEEYQAHRRILGVIGICHCAHSPDIAEAYNDFLNACKAYPGAQARRCFAFDPSDEQVKQDDDIREPLVMFPDMPTQQTNQANDKRQHLIIFPPSDRNLLEFHLGTMMQDFAASVLMALESWTLNAESTNAGLTTPLDAQQPAPVRQGEDIAQAKRRRLGRVQKTIGDFCLLAGSPLDAHAHYATAIELARTTFDNFWLAGALEGHVSALVVERGEKGRDAIVDEEVRSKYMEVIALYRRMQVLAFELEASFKLARYLSARRENAKDVTEILTASAEFSKYLGDPSDRLIAYIECSRIYGQLGYARKSAFFARQVAQQYQQQDTRWAAISALQILLITCPLYRVHSTPVSVNGKAISTPVLLPPGTPPGQWSAIQVEVLGDMLATAVRAGDPLAAWTAAARLLRHHYALITPTGQLSLAAAMQAAAEKLPAGTRGTDPALPFVRLQGLTPLPPPMQPLKRDAQGKWRSGGAPGERSGANPGPFLYSPFQKEASKGAEPVVWVVGEVAQVVVELTNPCGFEVHVESVFLSVEGGDFEAFPVSLSLLPYTASHLLALSGVPRASGTVTVRGCFVKSFGVLSEHRFDDKVTVNGTQLLPMPANGSAYPFKGQGARKRLGQRGVQVSVVPPLPLLVASIVGGEAAAVLYEGEVRDLQVCLTNAGVVPVTEAHVSLTGKHRDHVTHVGKEGLAAALPLAPGASVSIPVRLKAGRPTVTKLDMGRTGHTPAHAARASAGSASTTLAIHYAGDVFRPTGEKGLDGKGLSTILEEQTKVSGASAHGKPESGGGEPTAGELTPGRRVGLPLQLHVQRGLVLVQGKLLTLDAPESTQPAAAFPAGESRTGSRKASSSEASRGPSDLSDGANRTQVSAVGGSNETSGQESHTSGLENGEVALREPENGPDEAAAPKRNQSDDRGANIPGALRGSKIRLLELELWNGTDVVFEVAVETRGAEGGEADAVDGELGSLFTHPPTRIDRDSSARVLIPLRGLFVPRGGRAPGAATPTKQFVLQRSASGRQMTPAESAAAAHFEAYVDALCAQISVRWQSGLNSTGELPVRDAVREALQGPSLDALLPDLLGFAFRIARDASSYRDKQSPLVNGTPTSSKGTHNVVAAREMTPVELSIRNNSAELVHIALTVMCKDVTGTDCLRPANSKATVLWAGALGAVHLEAPPRGQYVHKFALCFLVPGEYTLVPSCIVQATINQHQLTNTEDESHPKVGSECLGRPFKIYVR
ncbi:Targeting complex (TRAPP) subunit [Klebsormidium nitens]|uniref:Targeting complex (TRAPP) subunit n=1 Tax=Klebsormidium nitens TaxID=105231 RepID=A0A1Y1I429_KLENI|nr:Targeting complex (TRAPP) subunit [Klebsormidium nitens]|eukprot:GAQ85694.1 Targeting complex (TRAPP) subunit [Klebsormidium nitens]